MSPAEPLEAEALRAVLFPQRIGNRVVVLEEVSSTNDVVFAMAAESEEGLVVFAERQTNGRGQHGRRWESSARQGLWFSILLRDGIEAEAAVGLTNATAQSIAQTLQATFGLRAKVKPPNDVYLNERKVAGVLLEMRAVPGAPHLGILGIGVNVNQQTTDFPQPLRATATSLAMECGRKLSRHEVAIAILRDLERALR